MVTDIYHNVKILYGTAKAWSALRRNGRWLAVRLAVLASHEAFRVAYYRSSLRDCWG